MSKVLGCARISTEQGQNVASQKAKLEAIGAADLFRAGRDCPTNLRSSPNRNGHLTADRVVYHLVKRSFDQMI